MKTNGSTLLKNYFKIAFRVLYQNKIYTFINTFGLTIGLSCFILILLYLQNEMSYDNFHTKKDRIYRLVRKEIRNDKIQHKTGFPAPMADALRDELPEIVYLTRLGYGWGLSDVISYGNKQCRNNNHKCADNDIFKILDIPFLKGDPEIALVDPYGIVISDELAKKLFGENNPIGKIVKLGDNHTRDYKVTGVMKNYPKNSHLQMDYLTSFKWYYKTNPNSGNLSWGAWNYPIYILINNKSDIDKLEQKFPQFIKKYFGEEDNLIRNINLQPLTKIHVDLNPIAPLPTDINASHIFIFIGIDALLLIMACFNFVNLSMALATKREKEIGIRKVNGASKSQIILQFLSESVLLTTISILLAIPLTRVLLPMFNHLAGASLSFHIIQNLSFWISLILFALIIGIISGLYPALFVAKYKPIKILKGFSKNHLSKLSISIRNSFIVFQFIITIIFLIFTLIVYNQVDFLVHKNLGYDKDHLIIVPISHKTVLPNYALYKSKILKHSNIMNVSATSYIPTSRGYYQNTWWEGISKSKEYGEMMNWIPIDDDFLETISIPLVKGRNFSTQFQDKNYAYILNESAVKFIGWDNPLGKWLEIQNKGPVVGVVKDFHYKSLHEELKPMAFYFHPQLFEYLLIKINPLSIHNTIMFLEQKWKDIFPNRPFEFSFYDEEYNKMYRNEINIRSIVGFSALISVLISCLGLFGLSLFSINSRVKEISIRKIFGASILNILYFLDKEITRWVLLANLFAFPIAYIAIEKWLQNFAYRIELSIWPFLLVGLVALGIALLTVSWQVFRASTANPVEALKYE
jgi:putative ABC transport system permease protein